MTSSAIGTGINTAGDIVGYGINGAFIYRNNVLTDLGTFGGTYSQARAINTLGQVVGDYAPVDEPYSKVLAFVWKDGVKQDILPLAGNYAYAADINDAGQVVGVSNGQVFVWQNGVMTYLGISGGGNNYSINNAGTVIGPEFIYQAGVVINPTSLLPPPAPGTMMIGGVSLEDINNLGQIVGNVTRMNLTTYTIETVPVVFTPSM